VFWNFTISVFELTNAKTKPLELGGGDLTGSVKDKRGRELQEGRKAVFGKGRRREITSSNMD
jgi:hypothetical protein